MDADAPLPDGSGSKRDLWEKHYERWNVWPPEAHPPSLDELYEVAAKAKVGEGALQWVAMELITFLEMSRHRSRNSNGENPLSFQDISFYSALNNMELHSVSLQNILRLDELYISIRGEQIKEYFDRQAKASGAT